MSPPRQIVAFGDSITKGYGVPDEDGWVELLARQITGIKVINAGGNGNTSAEGLARFQGDVEPYLPGVVIVEFGGNDPVNDPGRQVSPERFKSNLETIISRIAAKNGNSVLATFPVVIDSIHGTATDPYFAALGGLDQVLSSYRELTRECARRHKLPLFDLEMLSRAWIEKFGQEEIVAKDGIHWTVFANRLAAAEALKFLQTLFPSIGIDRT